MAADAGGVRIVERLRIKIGEAKNLPPRSGHSATQRDVYCCLSLDQEEIFRTSVAEKTLEPYFGEEFQFEVPREFRFLSIYVYDRDRQYKQDKIIGKVAIHREELKKYNTDHWFALRPVDADSEVQGQAHIEIFFNKEPEFIRPLNSNSEQNVAMSVDEIVADHRMLDRKNSKSKNSFKVSSQQKESTRFGSYSSTSSKRILTHVPENVPMSLGRSESLRSGQLQSAQENYNNTYGPSSSKSTKQFVDGVQLRNPSCYGYSPKSDSDLTNSMGNVKNYTYQSTENFSKGSHQHLDPLKNKLAVKVIECCELTLKNGQCDPHAVITVVYKNGNKIVKRTKAKKKTVNPKFDECFVFDLTLDSNPNKDREGNTYTVWPTPGLDDVITEISVSLWHENFFLGEVRLPLETHQHRTALNTNAWYVLGSRQSQQGYNCNTSSNGYEIIRRSTPSGTQYSNTNPTSLGSLRLCLNHTLDRVLSLPTYEDLRCLLLQQLPNRHITSWAVYILGQIINVGDIAQPLVRFFTHADVLVPTIRVLADDELSTLTDPTTIFRGNSLVSKMMDEAMKLTGHAYLKATLLPTLDLIFSEKKCCEIDPTKVKDESMIETNLEHLIEYIEKIFRAITQSFINCPNIMCRLFDALRQCASQKFPYDCGVRYSVISSFIFLRFFAPAILGPRLFDIKSEQTDYQTARTLTLISKTITTLGNLVSLKSQQVYKEEYMKDLYKAVCTEKYVQEIKTFLEIISTNRDAQNSNPQETKVLLKEGVMIKRTKRPKTFMRNNLKTRHFQLTNRELSYSKSKGKRPCLSIPLNDIEAVGQVTEDSNLKMVNMFQIVCKDRRTLYVQANNCVERKEWLDLLGKLCEGRNHPQRYHPSAYISGQRNCCGATNEDAVGCATVAVKQPIAISLGLDPARDLQRIHSLLYKNIGNMEKKVQPLNDESIAYQTTLKDLMKVTYSLEDKHRAYQRSLERETKYGSKQAPIGDDNYLHLASRNADTNILKNSQRVKESDVIYYDRSKMCHSMKPQYPSPIVNYVFCPQQKLPSNTFNISSSDSVMLDFKPNSSNYLTESLFITSSTESDIVPNSQGNNDDSSSSGYLTMMGIRNNDRNNQTVMKNPKPVVSIDKIRKDKPITASNSEYITSNTEKDNSVKVIQQKSPPLIKNKIVIDDTNNSLLQCQEYELISNFTSCSKSLNKISDLSPDTPPAIPPRNHNTISPSYSKYKKPNSIALTNTREYKSFDQYQLKTPKSLDDSPKTDYDLIQIDSDEKQDFYMNSVNNLRLNNTQETADTSNSNVSQERSQSMELCELPKAILDVDSKASSCITNIEISDRPVLSDNFQNRLGDTAKSSGPSLVSSKDTENVPSPDTGQDITYRNSNKDTDESKEGMGNFLRKSVQRKSVPIKTKLSSKKTNSTDGDLTSLDGSSKSQAPLSNRLTPSFLKRKAKINT